MSRWDGHAPIGVRLEQGLEWNGGRAASARANGASVTSGSAGTSPEGQRLAEGGGGGFTPGGPPAPLLHENPEAVRVDRFRFDLKDSQGAG